MAKIKIAGKNFLYSIIFMLIGVLVLSFFSYFNILNGNILTIAQMLVCFSAIMFGSYKQGKCSNKKGYWEGLKIGLFYAIIFVIVNLILYRLFHIKNLIYYLLILVISSFGGMIGISRKKNN